MSVRILSFNAIHSLNDSVIKKMFHKVSSCCQWGLSEMAYFSLGYFSTNNNLKVSLKSPKK
jgi:uncharacterized protein (DUF779 family)